jgi:hypothetical protein
MFMSIFYFYFFHVNYILSGLQIILDVFLALSPILSVFNLVVKFLCENSFWWYDPIFDNKNSFKNKNNF